MRGVPKAPTTQTSLVSHAVFIEESGARVYGTAVIAPRWLPLPFPLAALCAALLRW